MSTLNEALPPPARPSGLAIREFPADPAELHSARAFTRAALSSWGLLAAADDACLVVSELAANGASASQHAGRAVVLIRLRPQLAALLIEVGDLGHPPPPHDIPLTRPDTATRGRGLLVVSRIAQRWGWYRSDPWKFVWAEILIGVSPAEASHGHILGRVA